jgi:hypothetical protein
MYWYDVEFVFERMVILTNIEVKEPDMPHDTIIDMATQELRNYYKIDPDVWYVQDIVVHERD